MKEKVKQLLYEERYRMLMGRTEFGTQLETGLSLLGNPAHQYTPEQRQSLNIALEYTDELMLAMLGDDAESRYSAQDCFPVAYKIIHRLG